MNRNLAILILSVINYARKIPLINCISTVQKEMCTKKKDVSFSPILLGTHFKGDFAPLNFTEVETDPALFDFTLSEMQ